MTFNCTFRRNEKTTHSPPRNRIRRIRRDGRNTPSELKPKVPDERVRTKVKRG